MRTCKVNIMKNFIFYLLAFTFISFNGISYAQESSVDATGTVQFSEMQPPQRLALYQEQINQGDPVAANKYLRDHEVQSSLPNPSLKLQAEALKDLKNLLNMDWNNGNFNSLNKALMNRIGKDNVLSKSDVGPQPEKLLIWIDRFMPNMRAEKKLIAAKAIRQWEVVFGTTTVEKTVNWDGATFKVSIDAWRNNFSLQQRNSVIDKLVYNSAFAGQEDASLIYYSESGKEYALTSIAISSEVKKAINSGSLSSDQVNALRNARSTSEMTYLLGMYFDKNASQGAAVDEGSRQFVNSQRGSRPDEIFNDGQQRTLLGAMLTGAVSSEIKGTKAGDKVLDGGLKINVEPIKSYSQVNSDGSITLDSETIQQYMRLKGYTASSVLTNKAQLTEIAKYMSPTVVYQAAKRNQESWAKRNNVYKTDTQEDEIDAMSLEALYMYEKMSKDNAFYDIFTGISGYSNYAAKRVNNVTNFSRGQKKFADSVRVANADLPSLSSVTANTSYVVAKELERRAAMSAEERESLDAYLTYSDVKTMTPSEILSAVREIEDGALAKLQEDFAENAYLVYYKSSVREINRDYKAFVASLSTPSNSTACVVPAL